jgi:uncharacterized protein YjbI with pentapeptide repeats
MANPEHLEILERGVEVWNQWREENRGTEPDLRGAKLMGANLTNANLMFANLTYANLYRAVLICADLTDANLESAFLPGAVLICADLTDANLIRAYLSGADLINADISGADLKGANLTDTKLSGANLGRTQTLSANFQGAILTGACIQDWHINAGTNLQDVVCDYIYMRAEWEDGSPYTDRRPHDPSKIFAPGDFAKLVQKSLDTVDLIFREGLDWQAFAYSFNQLEVQYGSDQLSIHSIENQGNGTVIVKLNAAPTLDKAEVDQTFWKDFEKAQFLLSSQYEARLADKDTHINQLFQLVQNLQDKYGEVSKLMSEQPKYDLRGSKFGGGFAAEGGIQTRGTLNDYSTTVTNNLDEITTLIQSLHQLAQTFPAPQRDEVEEHLSDLQDDLKHPDKVKPSRLKATFAALLAIAIGIGGAVATATDFTNNVLELSNKFGIELVHPQANSTPSSPSPMSSPPQSANPSFSLPPSVLPTVVEVDVIDPKP